MLNVNSLKVEGELKNIPALYFPAYVCCVCIRLMPAPIGQGAMGILMVFEAIFPNKELTTLTETLNKS